jgi:hypothetical protein
MNNFLLTKKFNIGDRVRCKEVPQIENSLVGKTGTVVAIERGTNVRVEFDENIDGHECNDLCKREHSWYLRDYCLEHIDDFLKVKDWLKMKK